ncbi:DUF1802 family protein [Calothrix sp. PCC 6303]|nr:DUF1802 family protein [Calothrix sp. PCC 6303]AFZ04400.1 protein of unknown function DUF1802 [Calothrix sp. PCC 6303]
MNIHNGIQLAAFDVEMLALGKLILVPFHQTLKEGKAFWLYPSQQLTNNLSLEQYYKPEYLTSAKKTLVKYSKFPIQIQAWASCEKYWRINCEQKHLLPKIAQSTIWNLSALEHIFEQHQVLKILILRVFRLSNPCMVNLPVEVGHFYWSKSEDSITTASEKDTPVVSNANFKQRKNLLLNDKVYPYTNIESLQFQCEKSLEIHPNYQKLNHTIKLFLGWNSQPISKQSNPDLAWIGTIAKLGDRSIELDEKKSSYQAGTDFENIVRQSLEFLGFTIDYSHKGGAGGLDLFCSQPYPLVCECKAGKLIPSRTVEELIKLGGMHLGKDKFIDSAKLVIGPGNPSSDTLKSAQEWKVSIINAMTLQKLVELHAKYLGSINLFELEKYLEPGQIDVKLEEYIQKIEKEIELRSHIIQFVKEYSENTGTERTGVDSLHGFIAGKSFRTQPKELHEILIELSSPLTGYLGRIKGEDWKRDRFYFLRDLSIT